MVHRPEQSHLRGDRTDERRRVDPGFFEKKHAHESQIDAQRWLYGDLFQNGGTVNTPKRILLTLMEGDHARTSVIYVPPGMNRMIVETLFANARHELTVNVHNATTPEEV